MKPEFLDHTIFVDAARRIEEEKNTFACLAIEHALSERNTKIGHVKYIKFFNKQFKSGSLSYKRELKRLKLITYINSSFFWEYPDTRESQNARAIALYLCAELVKDNKK